MINKRLFKKKIKNIKKNLFSRIKKNPSRLIVQKAIWYNNYDSPVLFMIDDLTNAWYDHNKNGTMEVGEDWGAGFEKSGSAVNFLKENLLKRYPSIKTTFLTTVGDFQSFSSLEKFTYAQCIDYTSESKEFFKRIFYDSNYELAYHGMHHGVLDKNNGDFTQEWISFKGLEEAKDSIELGKQIFYNTCGFYPDGGKYCGYKYNDFSDQSIIESGFMWWCRDWIPVESKKELDNAQYDMSFIGKNAETVSVPANIHGSNWRPDQIKHLLKHNLPISIQEHIAPYRTDGEIQKPNIVHDIDDLNDLFKFLSKKKVWYASATECARYYTAREKTHIFDVQYDSFKIEYHGKIKDPILSVNIDARCLFKNDKQHIIIMTPSGAILSQQQYKKNKNSSYITINLPIESGTYKLRAIKKPVPKLKGKIDEKGNIIYNHDGFTGELNVDMNDEETYIYKINEKKMYPAKSLGKNKVRIFCHNSMTGHELIKY